MVLRKVCRPRSEVVTGGWTKLHTKEFHDLCFYSDKIKEDEREGACATRMGEVKRV